MLTIRLQRAGKKHQTQFRVVLADKKSAASKKFQEVLANYVKLCVLDSLNDRGIHLC
jgi:ribosomal protein S16